MNTRWKSSSWGQLWLTCILSRQCSFAKLSVFDGLLIISPLLNTLWINLTFPTQTDTHSWKLEQPPEVPSPQLDVFSFLKHLEAAWEFEHPRREVDWQLCQHQLWDWGWSCLHLLLSDTPPHLEEQVYKATSLWHRCSFNFSSCSDARKPSVAPGESCWLQEIYRGVNQRPSDRGSPYVLLECWLRGKGAGSE